MGVWVCVFMSVDMCVCVMAAARGFPFCLLVGSRLHSGKAEALGMITVGEACQ